MAANRPEWQFVDVAGQRLRFLRTGGDKAPIVLVHGFTDGAVVWQSLIRDLAGDYDVVAYDSRGHGGSSRVSQRYTFHDLADELAGLLEALGLARVGLIGHSMGAATAAVLAARRPDLVDWLVLEDPPFREDPPRDKTLLLEWRATTAQLQTLSQAALADFYRANQFATWREEDVQTRAEARLTLDLGVFDYMDWLDTPPWQEVCAALRCAGLLLCADVAKGAIVTPQVAQMVSHLWHAGRVVYVGGTGHHIRCGQPFRYAEALGSFLADMERRL